MLHPNSNSNVKHVIRNAVLVIISSPSRHQPHNNLYTPKATAVTGWTIIPYPANNTNLATSIFPTEEWIMWEII
jgi:hypothetical protein